MNSLAPTKYRLPRLDGALVPRPHLMAWLEQGLARQLTLVSAPAGYGKTTAVAMWAHARQAGAPAAGSDETRVAWYALDADDDDFSVFFTHLVTVVEAAVPGALGAVATGIELQNLTPASYANQLAGACSNLPVRLVLVLDDYHAITTPAIHEVLGYLIRYAADRLHLVLIGRYDPPLPVARLRLQRQVLEVRVEQLRLDAGEAEALLARRLAEPPAAGTLALLIERTEGWVAGLQLAAIALEQETAYPTPGRTRGDLVADIRQTAGRHIAEFLLDEVLERLPAALKAFLLKTALVASFNADLAAMLTGRDASACRQVLDELLRRNLFLVALDPNSTWFRYHHQFRTLLEQRAQLACADDELETLRLDAANWLATHGWTDAAVAEHLAHKRWEAAAHLLAVERHDSLNRETLPRLWQRLSQLPPEVVDCHPALLLAKAWVLQTLYRYTAVRALCEQATALLPPPPASLAPPSLPLPRPLADAPVPDDSPAILWGEVYALRSSAVYAERPATERKAAAEAALWLLTPPARYAAARGTVYVHLGQTLLELGESEALLTRLHAEIEAAGVQPSIYLATLLVAYATQQQLASKLFELQETFERLLPLAQQYQMHGSVGWAHFGLGTLCAERSELEAAYTHLEHVFDRPAQVELHALLWALDVLVPVAAELGRLDAVEQHFEQARRHGLDRDVAAVTAALAVLTAKLALARGDADAARLWAAGWLAEPADRLDTLPLFTAEEVIAAEVALMVGDPALVRAASVRLEARLAQTALNALDAALTEVLLACCYRWLGQGAAARRHAEQAVALGWPLGYRRVFYMRGRLLAPLLEELVQRRHDPTAEAVLAGYAAWRSRHVRQPRPGAAPAPMAPDGRAPAVPTAMRSSAVPTPGAGVASGGTPGVAAAVAIAARSPDVLAKPLTLREAEILTLVAEGLSNKEIATRLSISPITARNHISNVLHKLDASSRRTAIRRAVELGLLA